MKYNHNLSKYIYPFFAVLVLGMLIFLGNSIKEDKPLQLTIETAPVPILYPHEHELQDSIFDAGHGVWVFSEPIVVQEDTWITKFEVDTGTAPMTVLHHAGIVLPNEPNQICPNSPHEIYKKEIFSVTPDMAESPIEFPEPYGIFISKDTPMVLGIMLHNPFPPYGLGEIYYDVSVRVVMDIELDNPSISKKPLEYYRLHIDETPCPGAVYQEVFTVPPFTDNFVKEGGERNGFKPSAFTFTESGEIIYMISHLHPWEGGEQLNVSLNKSNLYTFFPTQLSKELWSWVIPHKRDKVFRVNFGDVLSITSIYSNPEPVPIVGAMGMLVFYFAPDDQEKSN